MIDAAAIIVAGGSGLRFGGSVRKQYVKLGAWPILRWSVHAFDRSPSMAELIVVAPSEDLPLLQSMLKRWALKKPAKVVAGGKTRADSVRQGLAAVAPPLRWVSVHDAVRPLVTVELIENVLRQARRYRAAIAACPSKDTVKISDAHRRIRSTPDRSTVWLAQTPQIFERRLLERAHAQGRHLPVTDDAQLVERLGVRVQLVESPPENMKVTVPMDLMLAKALLKNCR